MKELSKTQKPVWTQHARAKMRQYRLSQSRVLRVIRFPARTEEGIAPRTLASMQPAATRRPQEIWVMYQKTRSKLRIISAWRYPGVSSARKEIPIPAEIREELGYL